ncbi:hypothetical protein [Acidovorax sp. SUPP3334]|uniref:hypothetical protein n=1 Tax=Acidovorax sp. SUPP3334 TaxID=2920881 RepID=UPI0023DE681E|nr:hypothetical protein [Acidovorax sp. SUPP3334]GKT21090.1 hypothetical protein AVHM3334_03525 [Acidovorax sp. SUPP3334]
MKGLREPHFLLIGNPFVTIRNLHGIINQTEIDKIHSAILDESKLIFNLAISHYDFASKIPKDEWRQRCSRFYYSAYNAKRSISLCSTGKFATDVSDHKEIDTLPENLENKSIHAAILKQLRDDRNLADYSHRGEVTHLLIDRDDIETLVDNFMSDCKKYLMGAGVII